MQDILYDELAVRTSVELNLVFSRPFNFSRQAFIIALRVYPARVSEYQHRLTPPRRPRDRPMSHKPQSNSSVPLRWHRSLQMAPRVIRLQCLRSMPRSALFHYCYPRRVHLDLQTTSIQEAIAEFNANVIAIADLHARSLNALSERDSAANHSRLAELAESTRTLSNAPSKRIKGLKVQPGGASMQDAEIRKNRVRPVHNDVTET